MNHLWGSPIESEWAALLTCEGASVAVPIAGSTLLVGTRGVSQDHKETQNSRPPIDFALPLSLPLGILPPDIPSLSFPWGLFNVLVLHALLPHNVQLAFLAIGIEYVEAALILGVLN